ncbi:hypothetical protein PG984_014299 [Apiospora sp. TS-2023a]
MAGIPRGTFNFALGVAAYKGHNEIVRLLLDLYSKSSTPVDIVVRHASKANNLSTLELILDVDCGYAPLEAIAATSSLEIYQRLYPLAKGVLLHNPHDSYLQSIAKHMVLMAGRGAVPVLEHLLQLDIPGVAYWDSHPSGRSKKPDLLQAAARAGQLETVRWLLGRSEEVTGEALEAAAACGNCAVMVLLLKQSGEPGEIQSHALPIAVEREHNDVAEFLLGWGYVDLQGVDLAFEKARAMGLESMVELLSYYLT